MRLKIMTPTGILVDEPVTKVTAESELGGFGLLPRHVDYVAALPPGILGFVKENGGEEFVALDRGVLVKAGDEVLVSVMDGAGGAELGELKNLVRERYQQVDEQEKKLLSAAARLEADIIRRFVEL